MSLNHGVKLSAGMLAHFLIHPGVGKGLHDSVWNMFSNSSFDTYLASETSFMLGSSVTSREQKRI